MIDVHFENIHSQIINHISKAESDLKICVAWFTDVDIYNSILEVQKKNHLIYMHNIIYHILVWYSPIHYLASFT